MDSIKYIKFNEINPNDVLPLLNSQKNREHLIKHELFDENSARDWINSKIEIDTTKGCRVRAVIYKDKVAGWCGIQLEEGKYEIAIVIDNKFWGLGKKIFSDIMSWAKELGHKDILIHFLHTRPEYKFLQKIALNVYETELLGSKFTTYQLAVK
jgi:molybdopterin-binding protein